MPLQYVGHIGDVNNPQLHVRIGTARRRIANTARLRKRHRSLARHRAGGEPGVGQHADGGVIERGVDETLAIRGAPNGLRSTEDFLCVCTMGGVYNI